MKELRTDSAQISFECLMGLQWNDIIDMPHIWDIIYHNTKTTPSIYHIALVMVIPPKLPLDGKNTFLKP